MIYKNYNLKYFKEVIKKWFKDVIYVEDEALQVEVFKRVFELHDIEVHNIIRDYQQDCWDIYITFKKSNIDVWIDIYYNRNEEWELLEICFSESDFNERC